MSKLTAPIATEKGVRAIHLFIAELNSFKEGTEADKVAFGKECYDNRVLHELNYTSEHDRKECHENIWLQRLYDDLDGYHSNDSYKWNTPIEVDASASMLQYIGILLNDHRLTDMTNVTGGTLSDPWRFDGIPRQQFKDAATPQLYGSSKGHHELWQDNGHKYTREQLELYSSEMANGPLGLANQFKEFIINNCNPKEEMQLHIHTEKFTVECNRFRHVGDKTTQYDLWDTETERVRRIHHTTTKNVADLEQFRRYFVTALIHNLDSQVADYVSGKCMEKYGWLIPIHDAFIINPEAAEDVRAWYAEALEDIHANRTKILTNYFTSIGITKAAQTQWEELQAKVHPIKGPFKCNAMALK